MMINHEGIKYCPYYGQCKIDKQCDTCRLYENTVLLANAGNVEVENFGQEEDQDDEWF